MNMMVDVTEEQLHIEKKHLDIVELYVSKEITEEEGNSRIGALLKKAYKDGVFTRDDISSYNYRRDPKSSENGMRSHIKFAMDLRDTHLKEKKTVKYFVTALEKKGYEADYESFGTDDNGYVMIANFKKRYNTPNRPDYRVLWNETWKNVEVKNFNGRIWLKAANLEKYREWDSCMLIRFDGVYCLFSKKTVGYLLDNVKSGFMNVNGKPSVVITTDGKNAHYSLKKLIEQEAVKIV
jgi:hypothetical protein